MTTINQWKVCSDGIECQQYDYFISAAQIVEGGTDWLSHMARKNWVNQQEFGAALDTFLTVRGIHKRAGLVVAAPKD